MNAPPPVDTTGGGITPAPLSEFTSYDLGRVIAYLEDEVHDLPKAPAPPALRAACVAYLPWDHYWPDCWSDPSFLPRFLALRAYCVNAEGEYLLLRDALPALRALVALLEQALEES